jgi:hypothetical protein
LTHPVWLGALALLIVNDHLLKGAGMLPGSLTGKLSDFAGMLVAPALLALLLRVSTRRGWALAHIAVGLGFASINVSPPIAALVELLSSYTPFPWTITVDPSDMMALPALLLSYRLFARQSLARQSLAQRGMDPVAHGRLGSTEAIALVVAGVACMATSAECDDSECLAQPPQQGPAAEQASLTIGNATTEQRLVRVRPLKPEVRVNCEVLLADPSVALSRELFGPAQAWLLEPGRALPLQNGSCQAYLVDAQGMSMTLLAWDEQDYPTAILSTRVEEASDQMLMMRMVDGRLELDDHPAIHDAPSLDPSAPPPHCALPDETVGIDWTDSVNGGSQRIVAIESAADGCHRIETEREVVFVCLPLSALPFGVDEDIVVSTWGPVGSYPEGGDEAADARGIQIQSALTTLRAVRGNVLARKSAAAYDATTDYDVDAEDLSGCDIQHDSCGSAIVPLSVSLIGPEVTGVIEVEAGQSVALGPDGPTLYLVRAQRMPIRDTACTPFSTTSETYFESVLVWQTEQL